MFALFCQIFFSFCGIAYNGKKKRITMFGYTLLILAIQQFGIMLQGSVSASQ